LRDFARVLADVSAGKNSKPVSGNRRTFLITPSASTDGYASAVVADHSLNHGISWSGVIAGAFVTAALGLILLTLGFGLGLSSVSPWAYRGVSGKTIAESAIAWVVLSQIISGGMGGYLAGRLRHRWVRVHLDEIHFRDSAQGFLAWAVAVVVTAGFLATASTGMIGAPSSIGGYRNAHNHAVVPAAPGTVDQTPVVTANGAPASEDEIIEADRKAAAYGALWLFIALLGGAFSAAMFGTVGGRHRDHLFVYTV